MAILDFNSVVRTTAGGQTTSTIVTANNISNYAPSPSSTYYIGTTQNALNRSSASQTLTGVSIDGTANNITAYTINQNVGTANTPSFAGIVSSAITNYAFLQTTDTNNFWITPGNNNWGLYFETSAGGLLGGTGDSNRLGFVGAGNARFYVDLNNGNGWFGGSLTANTDTRSPIFYDSNNTAYYCDPASTSNLNAITLNNSGINGYLTLPGSVTVSNVSSSEIVLRNLSQLRFSTSTSWDWNSWAGLQYNASNTTIYLGGPAANTVFSANATPPTVTISFVGTNNVTSDSNFKAPIFYDSSDTTYYLDPAGTSRVNTLYVANVLADSASVNGRILLYGNLHIDAYGANDIYCNYYSGRRFRTFKGAGTGAEIFRTDTDGIVYAYEQLRTPILYDYNDTTYYIDPASTSNLNVLVVAASARVGGATSRSVSGLTVGFTDNSAFAANTDVGDSDRMLSIVNESSTTNAMSVLAFRVNPNGGNANAMLDVKFVQTGATNTSALYYTFNHAGTFTDRLTIQSSGNIGVNTSDFSYTSNDNSRLVGSNTNNRLFINGSIQLLNNNDAIVIGRGTATFLSDEELGFGWGGGWYMTDGTYLRVRNDKVLYTAGEIWGSIFKDSNNTSYYIDPASTSNLVGLTVANTITGSISGNAATATNSTQLGGVAAANYVRNDVDGTDSTALFRLTTITKSLTINTTWQDTGIVGANLATGCYMISVYVDNYAVSGGHYQETYTGMMSWFSTGTNSTDYDEIVLHKSGHASNGAYINLRTIRQLSGSTNLKLQIISSVSTSGASNYVFKFRRLI